MKRVYEVEISTTVRVEIDDEVTSDSYAGETILTAHENRERFIEGSTVDTAIGSIAMAVGIDNRSLSRVDGWADFPDDAASARAYTSNVEWVTEVTP